MIGEDDDIIRLIERYLDDEMSEDERNAFEYRLTKDSDLSKALLMQKSAIADIKKYWELKTEMNEIYSRVKSESNQTIQPKSNRGIWYGIAASIALLILALFLIKNLGTPNHKKIYASYYAPFTQDNQFRGFDTNLNDSLYIKAILLYNQQEYDKAAGLFSDMIDQNGGLEVLYIYLGSSYLNLDRDSEAKKVLRETEYFSDNRIVQHGRWYLALAELKSENIKGAVMLFE